MLTPVNITNSLNDCVLGTGQSRRLVEAEDGTLYVVLFDPADTAIEVHTSTDGGVSWSELNAAGHPTGASYKNPTMAFDGQLLHIAWWDAAAKASAVKYATINTGDLIPSWSAVATAASPSVSGYDSPVAIACDSNGIPHIAFLSRRSLRTGTFNHPCYTNRVGGAWNTPVFLDNPSADCTAPCITITDSNIPVVAYIEPDSLGSGSTSASVGLGNANNATSFTLKSDVIFASGNNLSIASKRTSSLSSSSDIGVLGVGQSGFDINPNLKFSWHVAADAWATWQAAEVVDSSEWNFPSLSATKDGVFHAIASNGNGIYYAHRAGGGWSGLAKISTFLPETLSTKHQNFNNFGSESRLGIVYSHTPILSITGNVYYDPIDIIEPK